ncbi:PucR family transcriptional regulator [Amycolatopsis sp. PS_44_ISF1]|uniref:PucR family transcriptional regulator n=1 Tax=Amycolatopsis sp. PS_44_ISF1 TaxID=2974917 RepID=UPI0028DF8859|nr:PucR family transcriptional regulator [Amycolatopsis sp. PS_44_ISF1]MDT8909323.1 PucR family transcriptional regulator [Amycolatopsis sp. PS_44_ISF1]
MALNLSALANQRSLGLRVVAGAEAVDRPIGWVHPTELTDPQAFLEGGELLLTTGLALDEATSPAYIRRLVEAGVAGLGFGVGLSHARVPEALVATAASVGLPVLEVPRETPFIAITRAVSRAVAADEYAATVRVGKAQQELTRTAVGRAGAGGVVRRLARLVDAWVVLFDSAGRVSEAAPTAARAYGEILDVAGLRAGTRVVPLGEDEVVLQTLHTRGTLAVGRREPLDAPGRHIVNTAVSLLSLALEQDRAQHAALSRLRTGLLELLAAGQEDLALDVLSTVQEVPPRPWTVLALSGPKAQRATLYDRLEPWAGPVFFAHREHLLIAVTDDADRVGTAARGVGGIHAGVAEAADFATALRQAGEAAAAARATDVPLVRYADHAGRGLLSLLEPEAAQAFSAQLLAPLRTFDATGRGELETSLRCWLDHHGHWDLAAAKLGVHRHTLRNRMTKAGAVLGRDLDSPGVRAELWLALQVRP